MDWGTALGDVNILAVLAAVVVSFVVGMIWYAPQVFGEIWMKEVGLKKKDMESKEGMPQIFAATAVMSFVSAIFLAALLIGLNTSTASEGALNGAVVGFALIAMSHGTHNIFSKKSMTLTVLTGAHDVLLLTIQGAILGAWL